MMWQVGTVERAFELARSGTCANVSEIRKTLEKEGFPDIAGHLGGLGTRRQLYAAIRTAMRHGDETSSAN